MKTYLLRKEFCMKECFIFYVNITSKNVGDVAKKLTRVVSNGTLNNTVDIVVVTSLFTKIINSLSGTKRTEEKVNIFSEINLVLIIFQELNEAK